MDELVDLVNEISINKKIKKSIKNIDDNDYFKFNDLTIELDKLEYENIKKKALIDNVLKWIKSNKNHTFPKSKKTWKNTFRTQSNFLKTDIKFRPQYIIENIISKKTPKYLEKICKKIYKIIETFNENINEDSVKNLLRRINIWCSLIVDTTPDDLIQILINSGFLIETDKNLELNEKLFLSNKKRKYEDIENNQLNDKIDEDYFLLQIKKIKMI